MVQQHLLRKTVIGGKGISWFEWCNWNECDDFIFSWLWILNKTARTTRFTCIHIHKIPINNAKIYFFLKSLREDMSRCITTSLKPTHVFAGFTKGTHHLLNLHTNYCIFLSRGQQPVNHDLAWGIWCTHRHRTHLSLLSLFHSHSLELLSTTRRPSAWISSLLWEPRQL